MEFLTINLDMEYLKGNISPYTYVDDILILTKETIENAKSIHSTVQVLNTFTGLDINENKSTMFFSKGANNKQLISYILNIKCGSLPIIYLGIPLSSNKLKARDYGWLIDKINKKN